MTARRTTLTLTLTALVAAAPTASRAEHWEIEILPPLATQAGQLPDVYGRDINERGQVAGQASSGRTSALFRYTPGGAMEDLDPDGAYRSLPSLGGVINDRGDVFGLTRDPQYRQSDIFVQRGNGTLDLLERGKTRLLRESFEIFPGQTSIPDAGHLCGTTRANDAAHTRRPWMWLPGSGWTPLVGADPRLTTEDYVYCKYTNERGDAVLSTSGPVPPGQFPPVGSQEAFVLIGGQSFYQLPTFGLPVNVTQEINDAGAVPGLYLEEFGRERAYVWTAQGGLVHLNPRKIQESAALFINEDSVVAGILRKGRYYDRVFTWSQAEGLHVVVRRRPLARLAKKYGRFLGVYVTSINESGAIVGYVRFDPRVAGGVPFYWSRSTGLVDLAAVVHDLGVDFQLDHGAGAYPFELNGRGDVLLWGQVTVPRRWTTAILSIRP